MCRWHRYRQMNNKSDGNTIFHWSVLQKLMPPLLWLLPLSFAVHAFGFYLFQVVYPPSLSLRPPAAEVTLDLSGQEFNVQTANWLAAEDPALIASVNLKNPNVNELLESSMYVPTFHSVTTRTAELPPILNPPERILATKRLIRPSVELAGYHNNTAGQSSDFAKEESGLPVNYAGSRLCYGLQLPQEFWTEPLKPARFIIKFSESQLPQWVFMKETSGNERADEWIAKQLRMMPPPQDVTGWQQVFVVPELPNSDSGYESSQQ